MMTPSHVAMAAIMAPGLVKLLMMTASSLVCAKAGADVVERAGAEAVERTGGAEVAREKEMAVMMEMERARAGAKAGERAKARAMARARAKAEAVVAAICPGSPAHVLTALQAQHQTLTRQHAVSVEMLTTLTGSVWHVHGWQLTSSAS